MAAVQERTYQDQITQILEAHPWTHDLRGNASDVRSDRTVIHVPPEDGENHFTTGSLSTDRCFVVSPSLVLSNQERTLIACYFLGRGFAGHRGIVHGGVISTILDECAGRAAGCHFDACKQESQANSNSSQGLSSSQSQSQSPAAWNVVAVTARMAVKFKRPAMTNSYFMVEAIVDQKESSARKATSTARLYSLADTLDGSRKSMVAEATAVFVNPTFAAL